MVYGTYNSGYWGYKPTYNVWGHHIVSYASNLPTVPRSQIPRELPQVFSLLEMMFGQLNPEDLPSVPRSSELLMKSLRERSLDRAQERGDWKIWDLWMCFFPKTIGKWWFNGGLMVV